MAQSLINIGEFILIRNTLRSVERLTGEVNVLGYVIGFIQMRNPLD